MMLDRLKRLERPIRVGIIGAGAMGRGLVYQAAVTPGLEPTAVADVRVERAAACGDLIGKEAQVVHSAQEATEAVGRGRLAACEDGMAVATCEGIDVLIESSSSVVEGAEFVAAALKRGTPVVLMNSETDLAFGSWFMELATSHGTVCTSCDGDQHGVIKRLVEDVELWGFKLVLAGNIKGFLNREADPTNIIPEADKRNLDYRMCTAYTDGSKLAIEMALLANSLGLRTDIPGMHGPRAGHVREATELFELERLRQGAAPVVDYVLGAQPDGGVFVVGHCDHPYQREMMAYYKMGPGPFYVFYRPYHLCHVEAMEGVAAAVLDREALLQPDHGLLTDVVAYAKQDLPAGTVLDGLGGYSCYGMLENQAPTAAEEGLPICMSEGVRTRRPFRSGERIGMEDVDRDVAAPGWAMWQLSREAADRISS